MMEIILASWPTGYEYQAPQRRPTVPIPAQGDQPPRLQQRLPYSLWIGDSYPVQPVEQSAAIAPAPVAAQPPYKRLPDNILAAWQPVDVPRPKPITVPIPAQGDQPPRYTGVLADYFTAIQTWYSVDSLSYQRRPTIPIVPAVTPGNLLRDTFTDVDGTALAVHTMDVGPGWTQVSGTTTIQSNTAESGAACIATTNAGTADYTLTIDLLDDANSQMVVRYTDANNHWLVRNNGGTLELTQVTAGSPTPRATSAGAGSVPSTVTITCAGATISAICQSASLSYPSATQGQTSPVVGLRAGASGVNWDNLNASGTADVPIFARRPDAVIAAWQTIPDVRQRPTTFPISAQGNQPPQTTRAVATFFELIRSWDAPDPQPQQRLVTAPISPPISNQPTPQSLVVLSTIIDAWRTPDPQPRQRPVTVPIPAQGDQPPRVSGVNLRTILTTWEPVFVAAQGQRRMRIVSVDNPPRLRPYLYTQVQAWYTEPWPVQARRLMTPALMGGGYRVWWAGHGTTLGSGIM